LRHVGFEPHQAKPIKNQIFAIGYELLQHQVANMMRYSEEHTWPQANPKKFFPRRRWGLRNFFIPSLAFGAGSLTDHRPSAGTLVSPSQMTESVDPFILCISVGRRSTSECR